MKILVLNVIIFLISIFQFIDNRSYLLDIEFAFRILNIFKRDNKSFCFPSIDNSISPIFKNYLVLVIKEINSHDFGYDEELAEEDTEIVIQKYSELIMNKDRCIDILGFQLIPDDCRVFESKNIDLYEFLITKFISKKDDLDIAYSGQMLAIACVYETFYKELIKYSGSVSKSEQFLADIIVFNDATKQEITDPSVKTSHRVLVEQALKFMENVLVMSQVPSPYVTICLVSKSRISSANNELRRIMRYYDIIVNEFKKDESETCDLSSLESNRLEELINILNVNGKFNKNEIDGIILGFRHLFENMDDTHIYLLLGIHAPNYKYITEQCNFDEQQFSKDYHYIIQNVIDNLDIESNERNYSLYLMKYCMLKNIRNHKKVKFDHSMLNKLNEILNAYDTFTYSLFEFQCHVNYNLCHKMIINNLRSDSEEFYLIIKNHYLMKLIFFCKLNSFQYDDLNIHYLEILHNFLYNYILYYCPYRISNLKVFADGISKELFGIRDDKIVSLRSIEVLVAMFLNKSTNNIKVTWFNVFENYSDFCHIKSNINYSLIDFEHIPTKDHYIESIKRTIMPQCSKLYSTAKFVDDFNAPVEINDLKILFDASLILAKNVSYISLNDNEKFNALKNSISNSLEAYRLSQGRQSRMDCEIERIAKKRVQDLDNVAMKSIYLHFASKYSNTNCLLDDSIFHKNKIPKSLVAFLKLYPSFEILDDNTLIAYIYYFKSFILNVSTQLLSYDYPDLIAFKLVDPVSCKYQKTSNELNTIILTYLESIYKDKEILWRNSVNFYKCLLLKDTTSFLSHLYNNNQLSPEENKGIKRLYRNTILAYPNLKEKNDFNSAAIFDILYNTSKLIDYASNKIKLSMVNCYIRKLHFFIIIHSTTTELSSTEIFSNQPITTLPTSSSTTSLITTSTTPSTTTWTTSSNTTSTTPSTTTYISSSTTTYILSSTTTSTSPSTTTSTLPITTTSTIPATTTSTIPATTTSTIPATTTSTIPATTISITLSTITSSTLSTTTSIKSSSTRSTTSSIIQDTTSSTKKSFNSSNEDTPTNYIIKTSPNYEFEQSSTDSTTKYFYDDNSIINTIKPSQLFHYF